MPSDTSAPKDNTQDLGARIRGSADGDPIRVPLSTSKRIIARVTDGIYREPWAAFRELCANAYDADAGRVVIETGAPTFEQIVVRDDGTGMSPEALGYVVRNIGGSSKRTAKGKQLGTVKSEDYRRSPAGRPLIGKIGIGLFAVAQLTQHFQIITKAKGEKVRTWATVLLRTHDDEAPTPDDPDEEFEAGLVEIKTETVDDSEIDAHGTTVVLHDLRPEIRRLLQSAARWQLDGETDQSGQMLRPTPEYHIGCLADERRDLPFTEARLPWKDEDAPAEKFRALAKAAAVTPKVQLQTASTLEQLDEYLQSMWKLSLALPLPYIGKHPFDYGAGDKLIFLGIPPSGKAADTISLKPGETIREKLAMQSGRQASEFRVVFDGVELFRPIDLPTELMRKSRITAPVMAVANEEAPFPEGALERAGGKLRFEAYLYWNTQITPKDIQGVAVRVHEASGTLYDHRFLNYQISEQNRLRQITAEVFVLEGLDGAINIDRESFNFSHPHYLYIQRWLHRALRLLINRLKSYASEDLKIERAKSAQTNRRAVVSAALQVWDKRRGAEDDPPLPDAQLTGLPETIAGQELIWRDAGLAAGSDGTLEAAVGVVLEAYGLLSTLGTEDRARLIADIIRVVKTHGV